MAIEIRRATSAADLAGAFALRRDVFIGEGIVRGSGDDPLFDIFDTVEENTVYIAVEGNEIVGTVRLTNPSPLGFPSDELFDFEPHLPAGSVASNGSMFCVDAARRRSSAGAQLLGALGMGAIEAGATHLVGALRPQAVSLVERTGGYAVGPEFHHPVEQVPVVPMICRLVDDVSPYIADLRAAVAVDDRTNPSEDQLTGAPR
ncbi:MAG: GNAT family N-acyltransferase [Actinomycetota bacterium]